jgi:hypothetical protein
VTERRFGNGQGTTGSQFSSERTFPGQPQYSQNGYGAGYTPTFGTSFGYGGYPSYQTQTPLGRETNYQYKLETPLGSQNQWSQSFSDGVRSVSQWASNGFQNVMSGWSNSPVVSAGLGGFGSTPLFGGGLGGGFGTGSFGGVSNLSAMPFGNALGFSGSSFMGNGMGFRFI